MSSSQLTYWECHHPNWLIFFRGVFPWQPPTRLDCPGEMTGVCSYFGCFMFEILRISNLLCKARTKRFGIVKFHCLHLTPDEHHHIISWWYIPWIFPNDILQVFANKPSADQSLLIMICPHQYVLINMSSSILPKLSPWYLFRWWQHDYTQTISMINSTICSISFWVLIFLMLYPMRMIYIYIFIYIYL